MFSGEYNDFYGYTLRQDMYVNTRPKQGLIGVFQNDRVKLLSSFVKIPTIIFQNKCCLSFLWKTFMYI